MRLTCEYELDILSNTKGSLGKDHGENNMNLRPLLARHLLRNPLFLFLRISKQAPLSKGTPLKTRKIERATQVLIRSFTVCEVS